MIYFASADAELHMEAKRHNSLSRLGRGRKRTRTLWKSSMYCKEHGTHTEFAATPSSVCPSNITPPVPQGKNGRIISPKWKKNVHFNSEMTVWLRENPWAGRTHSKGQLWWTGVSLLPKVIHVVVTRNLQNVSIWRPNYCNETPCIPLGV